MAVPPSTPAAAPAKASKVRLEEGHRTLRGRVAGITHFVDETHFGVLVIDDAITGKRVQVVGGPMNRPEVGSQISFEKLRYGFNTDFKRWAFYANRDTVQFDPMKRMEDLLRESQAPPPPRPAAPPEARTQPPRQPETTAGATGLPVDAPALIKYMTDSIPGVGEVNARKVALAFGEASAAKVLDLLDRGVPAAVSHASGVGPLFANAIIAGWAESKELHRANVILRSLGLNKYQSTRVLDRVMQSEVADAEGVKHPMSAVRRVCEHPYRITMIDGISFEVADRAGDRLGVQKLSPFRIAAAAREVMLKASLEGHTTMQLWELADKVSDLLDPTVKAQRGRMRRTEHIGVAQAGAIDPVEILKLLWTRGEHEGLAFPVGRNGPHTWVALPKLAIAEKTIAVRIAELITSPIKCPISDMSDAALDALSGLPVPLKDGQRKAIRVALGSNVAVITGGPGSGKTTISKTIISALTAAGLTVMTAAPTGCATKRLATSTGFPSNTLHTALEAGGLDRGFGKNEGSPLNCDVLLIDEQGFVDAQLCAAVLSAVKNGTRVIFVGDVDQLPSVGPGSVLHDIIVSGVIPVARLIQNNRQAEGIDGKPHPIAELSRNIRDGLADLPKDPDPSKLRITQLHRSSDIARETITRYMELREQGIAAEDIVVLTPMLRGACGVHALNAEIQRIISPNSRAAGLRIGMDRSRDSESSSRGQDLAEVYAGPGDRVMHLTNDLVTRLTNGDVGTVIRTGRSRSLVVDFGMGEMELNVFKARQLQLAYASTVHKSQGSEYKHVIMVLSPDHRNMLRRNLCYTGVTRAKQCLHLVGDMEVLKYAVHQTQDSQRRTLMAPMLRQYLREAYPGFIFAEDTVKVETLKFGPISEPKELMRA